MKNLKPIYCIALSFAFSLTYGQVASDKNNLNTTETANVSIGNPKALAINTSKPASFTDEATIIPKPEIKIYSQPFEGIVSVNLNECPDAQICLFDAKGNCLKYQNCKGEECAIFNLRNEPKGIYYMEIKSKGEKTVKAIYLNQNF